MLADEWAEDYITRTERRCRRYTALRQLRGEARDLIPAAENERREYDAETERLLAKIRSAEASA